MKKIYLKTVLFLFATTLILTACSKDDDKDPNPDTVGENEFKDPRDGKIYKTVKIGNQTWFAENLNFDLEGDDTDFCYDDDSKNCDTDGGLYTWEAAKKACPQGWHLGTKTEWETLIKTVTGQSNIDLAEEEAGKLLKKGGSSGFEAALSGSRNIAGDYYGKEESAEYWVLGDGGQIRIVNMNFDKDNIVVLNGGFESAGLCVRCIKDN